MLLRSLLPPLPWAQPPWVTGVTAMVTHSTAGVLPESAACPALLGGCVGSVTLGLASLGLLGGTRAFPPLHSIWALA